MAGSLGRELCGSARPELLSRAHRADRQHTLRLSAPQCAGADGFPRKSSSARERLEIGEFSHWHEPGSAIHPGNTTHPFTRNSWRRDGKPRSRFHREHEGIRCLQVGNAALGDGCPRSDTGAVTEAALTGPSEAQRVLFRHGIHPWCLIHGKPRSRERSGEPTQPPGWGQRRTPSKPPPRQRDLGWKTQQRSREGVRASNPNPSISKSFNPWHDHAGKERKISRGRKLLEKQRLCGDLTAASGI